MAQVIGNLSLLGFVDGLTAFLIILSSVIFGIISFYHARKLEAKLLAIAGLTMIFVGLFWLGPSTDFFMVLITGNNLQPEYLYGWLSYMWVAPAVFTAFYLGAELMVPEKKKVIVGIYGAIGLIFEILLFTMPIGEAGVFVFNPHGPGDLIDSGFNRLNLAFWLIAFFLVSIFIFLSLGFAIKARQATGMIRKKFSYLSIGFTIFFICGLFDALFLPGLYLGIWRAVMMTFALWMYLGLKT
ncbi:MAG: hypothetical protein GF383_04710 [Candidatus Lokiarchaeota archaeon]|nr:hypothetical protein [Candidatus Lokiarchaeota archaeon]MBD3339097.1 hypothetical protein [Candidatus Lokiarchaeota archaeon]